MGLLVVLVSFAQSYTSGGARLPTSRLARTLAPPSGSWHRCASHGWRLKLPMNRNVAQVFQPAGSGDFPVARWNGGLESPPNPQSGKTALQVGASSWSRCAIVKSWRLSMNRKVGRAVLCAPTTATTLSCPAKDGAHGVTRPTSANRFMAPMRVQSWRLNFPVSRSVRIKELSKLRAN